MPTQPSQATAEGMPIDRAQRIKNTAEQLVKQVKAGNVNPAYDFTDHNTIWQCMRLRSGVKLTKEEAYKAYTDALINDLPADKPELPVQRVTRLAYELSDALDEYADGTMMAAITPRNCSTGCPVLFGPISTHRSMVTLQANNTPPSYDPLLEAIDAYLAGLDDFNKNAPELDWEAYADRSFEPPLKILSRWTQPAWTRQGALKALQIAMDDAHGVYASEAAERMVKAAMGYLAGIQNYGAVTCE